MYYCIAIDGLCPWKGSAIECAKHDCPRGGDSDGL